MSGVSTGVEGKRGTVAPARAREQSTSSLAWGLVPIAIVAAALSVAVGDREPDACDGGSDRLALAWDEPARARVQAAFVGAEMQSFGDRVVGRIDTLAAAWARTFASACVAGHTRERAIACLDASQQRIAAAVAAFDDPRAVWRAGDLLEPLSPPERCLDAEALAEQAEPPRDREVAQATADVRERIAAVEALLRLDRVHEAIEPARAALRDAEATGWPPVIAEALLALGDVLARTHAVEEAIARTEAAHVIAHRGGHPEVAAAAGSLLVEETGRTGAYDASLEWAERTRAILERSAAAIALLPALDRREAAVLVELGRHEEAESLVVSSLALLEMEELQRPGETAWVLRQRANVARARGKPQHAIEWLDIAVETLEEAYGDSHSQVAPVLVDLGLARLDMREHDAARDMLKRALRIAEAALGPDHPELAIGLRALAQAELAVGRTSEAEALLERAQAIEARPGEP